MNKIEGYTVTEEIYHNDKTIIFRGIKEDLQKPVVIKIHNSEFPTPQQTAKLKREFDIAVKLKGTPGVIEVLEFLRYGNGFALIMEDIGGQSLNQIITKKTIAITSLLKIWIRLAETLGFIHQKGIIHKDIKPHNIILNTQNGHIRFIDFSVSSQLTRENCFVQSPSTLEGTLNYISPEQTGRMNRHLDYRTDFYSLGISFYEMLTGRLPFISDDQLELLHLHIAKEAVAPHKIPDIKQRAPEAVSNIIMKLISKTAEDRYQSAFGLKTDLEFCREAIEKNLSFNGFKAGAKDKSDRFLIPQKIYGREKEVDQILNIFNRVVAGQNSVLMISGHAGIGKTMLVQEVQKPLLKHRGYFISGKFDQLKRDIPYSALIQAFQDLTRQLLTEDKDKLEFWKNKITNMLGANAQIICEVIPEVELIIGKQNPVPDLPPAESLNRFNIVFQNFIRTFSGKKHPLTIFLDDLQWADAATLKFLPLVVGDPESKCLFLIGSYRNNEIDSSHPLASMVENIHQKKLVHMDSLFLNPLLENDITNILKDTMRSDEKKSSELSLLLINKTEGNPFFVNEFLKTAYEAELFQFDYKSGDWSWDLDKIKNMEITDNLVELMVSKIENLSESSQKILQFASCIGNIFNLKALSALQVQSEHDTIKGLEEALTVGLIYPLSDAYKYILDFSKTDESDKKIDETDIDSLGRIEFKFLHDRVQHAAYSMISEQEKKTIHRVFGEYLLQNTPDSERDDVLIEIVNHLNKSIDVIHESGKRIEIAELNLAAGKKAKASAAFDTALEMFRTGCKFLPDNAWKYQYNLALLLYTERAEMEYVTTHFEEAEKLFSLILENAVNILDKTRIYEMQIQYFVSRHRMEDSLNVGLEALRKLGVNLSNKSGQLSVVYELLRTKLFMAGRNIENLKNLPEMSDPQKKAISLIMLRLLVPAYFLSSDLMPVLVFRMVRLLVRYGNTPYSPMSYITYGGILAAELMEMERAEKFASMSIQLSDKINHALYTCQLQYMYPTFVIHWKHDVKSRDEYYLKSYHAGMEAGNLEYTSYSLISLIGSNAWIGTMPLSTVIERHKKYEQILQKINQDYANSLIGLILQYVHNMQGAADESMKLTGEYADEKALIPLWEKARNLTGLFYYYYFKSQIAYLEKHYEVALDNIQKAKKYEKGVYGQIFYPFRAFLHGLTLAALSFKSGGKKYIREIKKYHTYLKKLATHSPENFLSKTLILEAELARLQNKKFKAMELYEKAWVCARKNEFIADDAIAHELTADFYLKLNMKDTAILHFQNAVSLYKNWGAEIKVSQMETEHPELITKIYSSENARGFTLSSTYSNQFFTKTQTTNVTDQNDIGNSTATLDMTSVIKSSQALTSEFDLKLLLGKVMKILIESAGAQTGYLILEEKDELYIEAEGSLENENILVLQSIPVHSFENLPGSIINFAARTREDVVISDAQNEEHHFANDPYIMRKNSRSILCLPVMHQNKLIGLLYLENNLAAGAFTQDRVKILKLLSSQAAISIENARLYSNLEEKVQERTRDLQLERDKSDRLLLNILPKSIADELKTTGKVVPMYYESVTIMFTDFVAFTTKAESLTPAELVDNLNVIFQEFDQISESLNIEKLKIIGDAYMCAGGLPEINFTHHIDVCLGALRINKYIEEYDNGKWNLRIGIHTGPAMAGVIGNNKFAFDVWGDSVNIASRMEAGGTPGKINISEHTNDLVKEYFITEYRGKQMVKNKGEMAMYYLHRLKPEFSADSEGIIPNEQIHARIESLKENFV